MKGIAVGDLFIPKEMMAETFRVEGVRETVTDISLLEFECRDRNDIRRKIREIEAKGPDAVPAPPGFTRLAEDAEILAVHLAPVPRSVLERAKKLKVVCTARGGVDNISMEVLNNRRIPVINTPHHNTNAVAEYVVGLAIAETRNIARSHHALMGGTWRELYRNSECILELAGAKFGIIGFGQIGRLVARKLGAFDMDILVHDPYVEDGIIVNAGCRAVDLESLLSESDIVSIHVRPSKTTHGMIGERELRKMKRTSVLINTARARLVDLDALVRALKEGWIGGAAIDVFEEEPAPPDHALFSLDNVTFTNHRAGDTRNAYWKAPLLMGEQLRVFLAGRRPVFVANPQVFE
jgi:D-3-phosphoglycerate dehydrogenase